MFNSLPISQPLSLWKRIAAFLSFVAVLSALMAPAAILAEEVRTGKLGGLCGIRTSLVTQSLGDIGSSGASQMASHCDLCGSLSLAVPPLATVALPALPIGDHLARPCCSLVLSAAIRGLPPGRGPPSHL